jgi:single-strand DNA-binding protein
MASFNKIIIVGYLGRDPELRYMPNGNAVCEFSVATTEKRRDQAGEQVEITTWFRVSVWGKQGEFANQYLTKGRLVYVEGRLRQEEYNDREGNKRTALRVNASDIQFLGSRGDDAAPAPAAKSASSSSPQTTQSSPDDDEIPF